MMKTYVLTIAKTFPGTHPRKGEPTDFFSKIESGAKIHTIRSNYDLWKKRIDVVTYREGLLSLREWTGKPYRSPQRELKRINEVGIQKIERKSDGFWHIDDIGTALSTRWIARNDGLSLPDFIQWFNLQPEGTGPLALIHFTNFRY